MVARSPRAAGPVSAAAGVRSRSFSSAPSASGRSAARACFSPVPVAFRNARTASEKSATWAPAASTAAAWYRARDRSRVGSGRMPSRRASAARSRRAEGSEPAIPAAAPEKWPAPPEVMARSGCNDPVRAPLLRAAASGAMPSAPARCATNCPRPTSRIAQSPATAPSETASRTRSTSRSGGGGSPLRRFHDLRTSTPASGSA
jgi:hypothetical protein